MTVTLTITADKTKSRLNGFDHFWSVMMDYEMMEKSFTISDIYAFTGGGNPNLRTNIGEFLRRLIKAGIVVLVDEKNNAYRIVERQSATPKVRRDGTILDGVSKNQAMWNFMRTNVGAHGFTAQDIVAWASTDVTKISIETAKSYIAVLAKAGYLIEVIKGYPGKLGMWRLAPDMNTGSLPPMILRTKLVFDQNRYEVIGKPETAEVSV
ncbi:hypothetical protein HBA92_08025 [Ochrobactrum sp. MR28]|nr:hypothetical protein [Ochrobactrum sp. MR28]